MYRAEIYKYKKTGSFKLMLLVMSVFSLYKYMVPSYNSLDEMVINIGWAPMLFILFSAVHIALLDKHQNTIRNIVSSGMARSSIYYAKLKVTLYVVLLMCVVDSVIAVVAGLVYHMLPISGNVPFLAINFAYRLLLCFITAMLYFAIAYFINNTVWALMACLAYHVYAAPLLTKIGGVLGIRLDLASFTIPGISKYVITRDMTTLQILSIVITVVITLIIVLIVPGLTSKREAR